MKKNVLFLVFFVAFINAKAQYHLIYFSEDSIYKLEFDASSYFISNKYNESIQEYKKLALIDSLKKNSYYWIGLNYCKLKQPDSASFYFDKTMKLGFDSISIFKNMVSMYEMELQNYERAYNLLSEMIGYWPKNTQLYKDRASIWLSWKKNGDGYQRDMQKAADLGDIEAKGILDRHKKAIEIYNEKNHIK